jgi:hypothetical protein
MSEQWIYFDGNDDCDEECLGWNGKDNRCCCGNVRVTWSCMESKCKCKNDHERYDCPNAYAEAY